MLFMIRFLNQSRGFKLFRPNSIKFFSFKRLLVLVFCFGFISSSYSNEADLMLSLGQVEVFDAGKVVRIAVGNDEVVKVSVLDTGEIMFIPQTPGQTTVLVWGERKHPSSFRVSVFNSDMSRRVTEARSILQDFGTLNVRVVYDRLVIEGFVSPDLYEQLKQAVESVFPEAVLLVKQIRSKKMIEFKVRILEVQKRFRKEIGIDWDDSVQGPIMGTFGTFLDNPAYSFVPQGTNPDWKGISNSIPIGDNNFYPFGRLATSISSRIQLLQENGLGRILAEPVLTTQSGSSASFLAGGQIPYQTINQLGQPVVQFQDYGIKLDIEPELVGDDLIVSSVRAEVSSIDAGTSVNGVPGLLSRETESSVSLHEGQTLAISGLLSSSDSKAIEGVPFLSKIPILGELFKSKGFQEQRTELIILVTPRVIEAATQDYSDNGLFEHAENLEKLLLEDKKIKTKIVD